MTDEEFLVEFRRLIALYMQQPFAYTYEAKEILAFVEEEFQKRVGIHDTESEEINSMMKDITGEPVSDELLREYVRLHEQAVDGVKFIWRRIK